MKRSLQFQALAGLPCGDGWIITLAITTSGKTD